MSNTRLNPQLPPGGLERAMLFALWAAGLRLPLTADRVMARYRVSRATAYRWMRAWRNASAEQWTVE
ncbi:hypothetical protein [Pseudoxanthomonas jiangsuensis]|uniref:hypothetical protein n=1 Tax=Pseudoxanthomonas jiangsuensis TaxID=619688 RepID=UPI00139100B5|nr:hypothetical protein [Pseudoxanthomonas jiangsuensis]